MPLANKTMIDNQSRTFNDEQDVDMIDAPSPETVPRCSPKKLALRAGSPRRERGNAILEVSKQVVHSATTYFTGNASTTNVRTADKHQRSGTSDSETRRPVREGNQSPSMSRLDDEGYGGRTKQQSNREATPVDDRRLQLSPEQEWQLTKEGYDARIELLEERDARWQAKQEDWRAEDANWKTREMEWQFRERDLEAKDAEQAEKEKQWETETARATANKKKWEAKEKQLEEILRDIKIRWKSTAKELDALRAQGRGFYQVTDAYLEDLIARLRYNIRNFAIQYFSGALAKRLRIVPNLLWQNCMEPITEGTELYLEYLKSPNQRANIVQALLWRIFVGHVFNRFRWAGSAKNFMLNMDEALENPPRGIKTSSAKAEDVKRFHIWRGTTVALLLGSMDDEKSRRADIRLENFKGDLFEDADVCLSPMRSGRHEEFMNSFRDLVDEAVRLDKEISRQVACVVWTFETTVGTQAFDPSTMELEDEQLPAKNDKGVMFVVSPGVVKQGKSSGEEFDKIIWLLKMKVTCEAPMTD